MNRVVNLVQDLLRAGIGSVDLVDDEDGRKVGLKRLAEDVARLWQRAFTGIDQQHDAVDHLQRALDFSAEIAVARRVHDIDLHIVIEDGRVLGQNRDTAFALQVVGIHHPFNDVLVGTKGAALLQHGVNQRGLAMVHVGNNGDVTNAGTQNETSFPMTGKQRPTTTLLCAGESGETKWAVYLDTMEAGRPRPAGTGETPVFHRFRLACNCRMFWHRLSRHPALGLFHRPFGCHDCSAGSRFGAFRISVGEEHAVHGFPHQGLHLGEKTGRGHIERMAAAVDVYFNRVDIGPREKLLKVGEHGDGLLPSARFRKQVAPVIFAHGRVAGDDVVLLLVAGLVADGPVRDDKIGESIPRTPRVIALVEYRLVEDEVYDRVGNVADLVHGIVLLLRESLHDAPCNELRSGHNDGFRGNRL